MVRTYSIKMANADAPVLLERAKEKHLQLQAYWQVWTVMHIKEIQHKVDTCTLKHKKVSRDERWETSHAVTGQNCHQVHVLSLKTFASHGRSKKKPQNYNTMEKHKTQTRNVLQLKSFENMVSSLVALQGRVRRNSPLQLNERNSELAHIIFSQLRWFWSIRRCALSKANHKAFSSFPTQIPWTIRLMAHTALDLNFAWASG